MARIAKWCSVLLLAAIPHAAGAQGTPVEGPKRILSLGIMALGDYEGDGAGASAEWRVAQLGQRLSLGIGGMTGVQRNTEPFGSARITNTTVPLFGIANVRYQRSAESRLQLYTGLSAGVTQVFVRGFSPAFGLPDERGARFGIGAQVGARYGLFRNGALMLQVGVGDNPGVFGGMSIRR